MKKILLLALLIAVVGCSHVPDPCADPIRVPAPYWNPPKDLPELQPMPSFKAPTYTCVSPDPSLCVETTMEVIAHDFLVLLADDELCRFQYGELVSFIESVPEVPPPPSGTPPFD